MIKRKKTKVVKIGTKKIGGNFPILVQSMTNTKTSDLKKTLSQIKKLEKEGCEIIRVGVPDMESAKKLSEIKKRISIPLVADIHFPADLAIEAIKQGVDKIRINPGNFPKEALKEIVELAKKRKIAIRIGINSGSLEKEILRKYKKVTAKAMVESAIKNVTLMENLGFTNLVISVKAPDIFRTIEAYQMISEKFNYPLHLGITEAGGEFSGTIKSAIGLGYLLLKGIGDTIRVSLTGDPINEVKVAWEILKSLGLRERGAKIISCPTCARTTIDVLGFSEKIEKMIESIKEPIKIAVMGCIVNGLGEAKEADFGLVGLEKKKVAIFEKGKFLKTLPEKESLYFLKSLLAKYK